MEVIIIAIFLCIFIICIYSINYISKKRKYNLVYNALINSTKEINEYLDSKEKEMFRLINILENKLKLDEKLCKNIKKDLAKKGSSYEKDSILENNYNKLDIICQDYIKEKEINTYKEIKEQIDITNIHLMSLRTFFNKYALIYNDMIKRGLYKQFSNKKKFGLVKLYEEKEVKE